MKKYDSYKDSGIKWLGEIPEHWEVSQLKYFVNIQGRVGYKGYTVSDLVNEGEGPYTIGAKHISKHNKLNLSSPEFISWEKYYESPEIMVQKGDLLLTQRGTLGKVVLINENIGEATINPSMVLLNKLQAEGSFLYYFFFSDYFVKWVDLTNTATAVPMISQEQLGNFKVTLPPLAEQTLIANYLDHKTQQIDELIAKKERLIELLNEERTATINQAVTKGINPNVPMKDSGIEWLGEIPEHWEVKSNKFIFQSLDTKRIPLSSDIRGVMENKKYDYYGASGVIDTVDEYLFDEDLILIGEDGANLITRSKRLAFIATGKYWVNNHAHILKPINSDINYMCELLELNNYDIYITGSAQPKLTQEALLSIKNVYPPYQEQKEIAKYLETKTSKIDKTISTTEREIDLLKEYKTALISEAVAGKIDVRNEVLN